MSYQKFVGPEFDTHYLAHVGWDKNAPFAQPYRDYFSAGNMKALSDRIHQMLLDRGFNVRASDRVIGAFMSSILTRNTPVTGDIYSRYVVPQAAPRDDVENMNDRVVNGIASTILDELETERANKKLTAWTTVLGDFNDHGLRAHSIIKVRENGPQRMLFNMKY